MKGLSTAFKCNGLEPQKHSNSYPFNWWINYSLQHENHRWCPSFRKQILSEYPSHCKIKIVLLKKYDAQQRYIKKSFENTKKWRCHNILTIFLNDWSRYNICQESPKKESESTQFGIKPLLIWINTHVCLDVILTKLLLKLSQTCC